MGEPRTFVDRLLAGEVRDPNVEIDDAIDAWHDAPAPTVGLYEWLGMTAQEYRRYAEQPTALRAILEERRA